MSHASPKRPYANLAEWDDVRAATHATGQRIAHVIADTLRLQFPAAAYLVMHRCDYSGDLYLDSVRDARSVYVWDFRQEGGPGRSYAPIPSELAQGGSLLAAWGRRDPTNPAHLQFLLQELDWAGCGFDVLPDDLDGAAGTDDRWDETNSPELCLLLSDQARPARWDHDALRPYSAVRPAPRA
ncbi:hypothetical protein [Streptomyces sp. H39-C1]|uniref:hypothetical protein n=1 Tax=Streptomyces sp. H39-C1 TaxID=3004355 RepID=UPI0022AFFE91|nr:hypothetical protein [Streptomyces sp. H39-C1]MCZ4098094.1 hypothetical protein [Streptomyces sp. H39-C1]